MNKKQWTALLFLYVGYLCFGASIFQYLEHIEEKNVSMREEEKHDDIIKEIKKNFTGDVKVFYEKLSDFCGKPIAEEYQNTTIWDFYNSFFFVVTVVSTIGYGNLHPTTTVTRILMIFYAIIGIPLNGILLTSLAQFFSHVFIQAHKKYKRYESRFGLAVDILTYLTPGFLLFIFLPAGAFMYFEDWEFDKAVYYAFVTLTTIGFGDLVAGQKENADSSYLAYQVILLFWIIFGLGYLIMLLGFVTRAMSSKKMIKLEHKLVEALTHNKLWHGFSKDLGYLRRIMNEIYMDKFKPVFHEDDSSYHHHLYRSKSLPDLVKTDDDDFFPDERQAYKRRRALSEFMPQKLTLNRVFSENDLLRIDRNATFRTAALIQPTELLRQVVDALGGTRDEAETEPHGVDVFSDEEVLQSEGWYIPPSYEVKPALQRSRAQSECPAPHSLTNTITAAGPQPTQEWTWSGPNANKIQDLINHNTPVISDSEKSRRWLNPLRRKKRYYSENSMDPTESSNSVFQNGDVLKKSDDSKNFLGIPNLQMKRTSLQDGQLRKLQRGVESHYMTHTAGAGTQGLGLLHGSQGLTKPEQTLYNLYTSGNTIFNAGNHKEILEETSLADFLRVLTSLHSRVGERLVSEDFKPPKQRKLGTASLTPPRINSLLSLFPPPEPPPEPAPKPKRKFSLMPSIFSQAGSRRGSSAEVGADKPPDPSNFKRLGRFLLQRYSLTPKTSSNPDVSLIANSRDLEIPSIVIQGDSPQGSVQRTELQTRPALSQVFREPIRRSNTIDPLTAPQRRPCFRRSSTPSAPYTIVDMNPALQARFKTPSASTESVFIRSPGNSRKGRHKTSDTGSQKPGLDDVKEVQ